MPKKRIWAIMNSGGMLLIQAPPVALIEAALEDRQHAERHDNRGNAGVGDQRADDAVDDDGEQKIGTVQATQTG
jgi:hypothetical protein